MKMHVALVGAAAVLLLAAGMEAGWLLLGRAPDAPDAQEEPLPLPPLPPRIAEGGDYERCLALLDHDPQGAAAFAESLPSGSDAAQHCEALALLALGQADDAADLLEKLAAGPGLVGAARATVLDQAGQARLAAQSTERAWQDMDAAVRLSPGDPDLLLDRAVAAGQTGRDTEAADDLTRVLDGDPARADVLVLRAAARRRLGHAELAAQDVDRALAADPDNPEALLERGIERQRAADGAGARADWERAITVAPDTSAADLAQQNLALLEAGPERR